MKISKKLPVFLLGAVMVLSLVVSVSIVASASADGTELYRFEVTEASTEQSVGSCLSSTHFYDATNKVFKQTSLTQELVADPEYGKVWHVSLDKGYSGLASLKDENKKATGYDKNGDPTIADTAGTLVFAQKDGITYKAGNKYVLKVRAKATDNFPLSFFFFIGTSKKIQTVENSKFSNVTYPRNYKTFSGDEWVDYEFEFTVKGFTNAAGDVSYTEHTGGQLRLEFNGVSKAQDIYIDSVILTEYEPASGSAVFAVDEGVTVKNGNAVINSGECAKEAYAGAGVPKTFTATVSDPNKSATVFVNDKKWASGADTFEFTIPDGAETVSVELNDKRIVYANYFNSEADLKVFTRSGASDFKQKENGDKYWLQYGLEDGCLKIWFEGAPDAGTKTDIYPTTGFRLGNLSTGIKLQPGHNYTHSINFKSSEKASAKLQYGSKLLVSEYKEEYFGQNNSTTLTANVMKEYSFTKDYCGRVLSSKFGENQATDAVPALFVGFASNTTSGTGFDGTEVLWVDEIEIIDNGAKLDTVTTRMDSTGGTLKRKIQYSTSAAKSYTVVNGAPAYGSAESTAKLTFVVTPSAGKVAVVRYYNVENTYDTETEFEVAVDGNTTLDISFVDATKTAVIEKTTILHTDDSVYVYSLVNQFNPALDANKNLNFGIKLWNAANDANFVILNAKADDEGTDAVAQFGQAFAIKACGAAITADNTYEAQAFVGTEYGDVVSTAIEEN